MSKTLSREALSCTVPNASAKVGMGEKGLVLTFLDGIGVDMGTWTVATEEVHYVDGVLVGTVQEANQAANVLLTRHNYVPVTNEQEQVRERLAPVQQPLDVALCMGLTKALTQCQRLPMTSAGANVHFCHAHQAQGVLTPTKAERKAAKKAAKAHKTPSVTPVAEVRKNRKESTMSTKPTLASTNGRIDALATEIGGLKSLLTSIDAKLGAQAPAKVTEAPKARKAPKAEVVARCTAKTQAGTRCQREGLGGLCGSHKAVTAKVATKARKATKKGAGHKANRATTPVSSAKTKGARPVASGSGLSRSAWNKTLTTKARLAGKRKGTSVYSLVIADWTTVQQMRVAGQTPDQVLATFAK